MLQTSQPSAWCTFQNQVGPILSWMTLQLGVASIPGKGLRRIRMLTKTRGNTMGSRLKTCKGWRSHSPFGEMYWSTNLVEPFFPSIYHQAIENDSMNKKKASWLRQIKFGFIDSLRIQVEPKRSQTYILLLDWALSTTGDNGNEISLLISCVGDDPHFHLEDVALVEQHFLRETTQDGFSTSIPFQRLSGPLLLSLLRCGESDNDDDGKGKGKGKGKTSSISYKKYFKVL